MQYCINYYQGCKVLSKADEIKIKLHADDTLTGFETFVTKELTTQPRIIIDTTYLEEETLMDMYEFIVMANEIYPNLAIETSMKCGEFIDFLAEIDIPYFFGEHINSWVELREALDLGASDVYITDALGFSIEKVREYCDSYGGVRVRVFPNVAQCSEEETQDITSFFIRPEDEFIYDEYVDVYEFWGPLNRQDVLMKIYKSHKWLGDLDMLILNLSSGIESPCLPPQFGYARTKCQKHCRTGSCKVCSAACDLAKVLRQHDKWIRYGYPQSEEDKQMLEDLMVAINTKKKNIEDHLSIENS